MKARVMKASSKFFDCVTRDVQLSGDQKATIGLLIDSAFLVYDELRDRNPLGHVRIDQWYWPFDKYANGERFDGDEPWTVLLRRAILIVREFGVYVEGES